MFLAISNTPRPYAWGSKTAIAELLGRTPSGEPEAELWLGAHPGSPSGILEPAAAGGAKDLATWVATDPARALGPSASAGRLPFLLKVLAASAPLSLQAHPTPEQARRGFVRENEAGVEPDAPNRNYKDEFAKPELIFALSEEFEALCGFRPLASFRDSVSALIALDAEQTDPLTDLQSRAAADDALPGLVAWLSNGGPDVDALVDVVSRLAAAHAHDEAAPAPPAPARDEPTHDGPTEAAHDEAAHDEAAPTDAAHDELALVARLAEQYPGDPGVVIALLLNHVTLARGEALYLPAGNIHAYLSGLGVELMAASDNVIRGGLTPKHVDVPELLEVLDFSEVPVPYLRPDRPAPGVEVFRPDVPDFTLVHFTGDGGYEPHSPAIALCTAGSVQLTGALGSVTVARGEAVFVTPDEGRLSVTVSASGSASASVSGSASASGTGGGGELFLATTGS